MATNREVLATAFPLHFQRICEIMYEQDPFEAALDAKASDEFQSDPLACAFYWAFTLEGPYYWGTLADRAKG